MQDVTTTKDEAVRFRQDIHDKIRCRTREVIETVLEEELTAALGSDSYERNDDRRGYRNGAQVRTMTTAGGSREVRIPRGRLIDDEGTTSEFRSEILPRYARRTKEVDEVILGVYLAGANSRRIRKALDPILGSVNLSKSAVSRVVGRLKALFEAWSYRDLSSERYAVLYLDGFHLKIRVARRVVSVPVLAVLGVAEDGTKVLISLRVAASEAASQWSGVLIDFQKRGLVAPHVIVADGHAGLHKALDAWSGVLVQRCTKHKLANLEEHCPVGTEAEPQEWAGAGEDEFVSRVSVFDSQCAAVYLTEKTDVAFRPFGLDLFDKLVRACKAVRAKLESEQRALASNALAAVQAQVPVGTAVAKLLASISSLTKPGSVEALARLSPEEEARLALLEKSLLDLQVNDPEKLIRQLTLRAGRVKALAQHLKEVEAGLSEQTVAAGFDVRTEAHRKSEEATRLRGATFPAGMLAGTGSEPWTALWEAARRFSQEQAYPGQAFPVIENGAHCVLCQQDLDHSAGHRLRQFEASVASTTERELRQARETFARMRKSFTGLETTTDAIDETLKEIRIEHEAVADAIDAALATNETRRKAVVLALTEDKDLAADSPAPAYVAREADALAEQIEARVKTLRTSATDETSKRMTAEAQELHARKLLALHEPLVLNEIERKKRIAAYELCINDTTTNAITQKSTAVTKIAVSQKLKQGFKDELTTLAFRHVEVELKEAGGADGVLYHKLILTRAPGVELPKVVSEGEQRCLSIAAFFAELSTADDPSGIVFDDPVSSLDYRWREGVARRLVQEAKTRQVIVFTHDIVFLLMLKQFAEEQGVAQLDQHVRQLSKGAGVCAEELPWVAMPVTKKIGYLKNEWQAADKLFRDDHQTAYEKDAKNLYGLLREAWERALEEVLLGRIVERFRPGVQTLNISALADITVEDCRTLDAAMTKCSKWLTGHDQAAAARAPVPEPAELKADIEALENWVAAIRSRRR